MKMNLLSLQALSAAAAVFLLSGCANMPMHKEQAEAHYRMANSFLHQGRGLEDEINRRRAYPELVKAIQLDPKNATYHSLLGTVYIYSGEMISAQKELEKALAIDPDYGEARNNLGLIYMKQERPQLAIEEFKKAISNYSYQTPEQAYFNLGQAYRKIGDYQQAVIAYEKALSVVPNWGEALYFLGRSNGKLGRLDEAEKAYRDILEINETSVRAHMELAVILLKLQRREPAATHFKRVVELAPESESAEQAKRYLSLIR